MSIPPLVCSTPPPPDQCDDDRDTEDFDVPYNLSQEDEDENDEYGYGSYSSFNHLSTTFDQKPLDFKNEGLIQTAYNEIHKEIFIQCDDKKEDKEIVNQEIFIGNDLNENNLKCEEDVNIEDLDLKVEDEVNINTGSHVGDENSESDIGHHNVDSQQDLNIPSEYNSSQNINDPTSCTEDVVSLEKAVNKDNLESTEQVENEEELAAFDIQLKYKEPCSVLTSNDERIGNIDKILSENLSSEEAAISQKYDMEGLTLKECETEIEKPEPDDDFGDFDEFQSVNITDNVSSVVETCENPWGNVDTDESSFANFTANFEDNPLETDGIIHSNLNILSNSDQNESQNKADDDDNDDDEFGDFDDFKSSSVDKHEPHSTMDDTCHELPVLNLHSSDSDHQVMETITKMLSEVFVEEIPEPTDQFEGKLESFLSETWGHLRQIDERQPYIVNWNNSLGQKTLLKALCIDSRNILFGPKWNSSMPKFAANLSNAPLQPQKQSSTSQNEVTTEKSLSKPSSWNDPFTSEGQDSCNPENEGSAMKPGPTDLAVFEATVSKKSEKIYSSTLGVQPLRQINLPDTHIFTPTDSEIPRSKTIHYDSGPSVLLPQPVVSEENHLPGGSQTDKTENSTNADDNEYWEFQDFKGSTDTSAPSEVLEQSNKAVQESNVGSITIVSSMPQPSIAYQTQLLQPIKVEPAVPSLNWPDPGEVKCVFDDFSDFVSIPTEVQDTCEIQQAEPQVVTTAIIQSDSSSNLRGKIQVMPTSIKSSDDAFDDDFDTFKSALPTSSATLNYNEGPFPNANFTFTSDSTNSLKSDTISNSNSSRSDTISQSMPYTSEFASNNSISIMQPNVLQPTQPSSSVKSMQNQQKSAQILQPLNLESYSQINWPSPGIDLQDLSRFNPVESLQSFKSETSSKNASPVHTQKNTVSNQMLEDDVWGEFVSSKPKQQNSLPKTQTAVDDDEWTDFISSPSVKPQNGLNTISLNVHTYSNIQKTVQNKQSVKTNHTSIDIPSLNYITPKSSSGKSYNDKHFQNL